MAEHTYKVIELVGVSTSSYADATRNAIAKAAQTLKGLSWFEVTQMRGTVSNGRVGEFQVTMKVGFRVLGRTDLADGSARVERRARSVRRAATRR